MGKPKIKKPWAMGIVNRSTGLVWELPKKLTKKEIKKAKEQAKAEAAK